MADKATDTTLDALNRLSQAYRAVFDNPNGELVLADLANFCRANESTFHPDVRMAAQLDGRREIWLRIQRHLNLTPEQILSFRFRNNRRQLIEVEKE